MATRRLVSVLGIAAMLAGCSGDEGGPNVAPVDSGADGGDAGRDVPADAADAGGLGAALSWYCPVGAATCPAADVTTYNRCLLDRCQPSLEMCPCESWINCTTRCDCGDLACRAACIPTFDCLVCGQSFAQCVKGSGCERPACYDPPPPDLPPDGAARDTISVVVGPGFPVPAPARDAAVADTAATDGGLQGTCDDLRRCCDSLASPTARATCQSQLTVLTTDPLCAAALLVYRGNGMCQ
jgi:hypothetical protein